MTDLVYLEPNCLKSEPFTTSKVISEFSGVSHKYVKKQLSSHQKDFMTFGLLGAYTTKSTGGRPEEIIRLNEEQAYFLMTLFKNTPVVIQFKKELTRQFFQMRNEIMKRQIYREELKPIRRTLTDAINAQPDHSKWDYKLYTDLAYKAVTGKNAAQLRKERGADKKAIAIEYMTSLEIAEVTKRQNQLALLVDLNLPYDTIKTLINRPLNNGGASLPPNERRSHARGIHKGDSQKA